MNNSFLEYGIPDWLKTSIKNYVDNKNTPSWDCFYCELQTDINIAETEQFINEEQAWYLRKKYLNIQRSE